MIGVVVHGPNIVDSGYAKIIVDYLKDLDEVFARLGGTMGRTAVIDKKLEDLIDISKKLVPSDSLRLFNEEKVDLIFLLNYGKSDVTGQVFGYKVYNHYKNKIKEDNIPIIQIERPGETDGSVISWNGGVNELVNKIASDFGLNIVTPLEIYENHFKEDDVQSNRVQRIVHGVSPNENIMVNSVVIGKSDSDKLILIAKDGYIVDIVGGKLKRHGLEKLGKIDLDNAIIKTGLLRKAKVKPRVLNKKSNTKIFKLAFLNHAGEDVYKFKDVNMVVTVGDDTTLISSDILYRFAIPVIGITDGDLDKVVEDGFKVKNSIIFEVESGYDDIVGEILFKEFFNSKNILEFDLEKIDSSEIIDKTSEKIIEIINSINCKYKINYIH